MHKIAIGCDPNAVSTKQQLISFLTEKGYEVRDFGSDDPIYTNVAIDVAGAVAQGVYDRGILICGTGIGMCISANKVKGAYAVVLADGYSAARARMSNDANIACFGAFTVGPKLIEALAEIFLTSEFEPGSSSQPKVDRLRECEQQH